MGSRPTLGAIYVAEVAELAAAQDLTSCEPQIRTGSSPVFGTKIEKTQKLTLLSTLLTPNLKVWFIEVNAG